MRQTLRNLPPRMVSRKWTFQLSRGSVLPSAAAMPPSAMTVWALPSRLFDSTPVLSLWALHSIAARSPAPPAPTTSTSWSMVWIWDTSSIRSPGMEVADDAHREQAHVEVGDHDPDQAEPCELHVARVEPRREPPALEPRRRLAAIGQAILAAADQVAERVAAERVRRDQHHVERQDQAADADPDPAVMEERLDRVLAEDEDEQQREVQREAVQVLEQQQRGLAAILAAARQRTHRAARR